jgi:ABC-type branched-subunit amino acid transport system ATPase component
MRGILQVDKLVKAFKGLRAIDGVSFAVEQGSITSIVGPNGAGKSTLFNMISGYLKPTSGEVRLGEVRLDGLAPHQIAALGIARAFQIAKPFPRLSVERNVMVAALFGRAGERDVQDTVDRAISICRLHDWREAEARTLSIGNLRRLELARAIAARPVLLLADEPCAGLNETETLEVSQALAAIRDQGVTVLLVEHDIRAVRRISDRVIVIEAGRKIADGKADDVFARQEVIDAYLGVAA